MNEEKLYNMRHTLSHVLAEAVLELFPYAKLTIGPVIENGFYYDFDLEGKSFSEADVRQIEKKMRKIISEGRTMKSYEKKVNEAIEYLKTKNQPYKVELAKELKEHGEKVVSFYTLVDKKGVRRFKDLCKGGHTKNTQELGAFMLTKIAGAYWRGDEKNSMLQRIYGVAFETEKELDEYVRRIEEAKKRDHKKLGIELDLFAFSDLVGSGLPLWTPRGTLLRNIVDDFVWELRRERGYQKVEIPHITKKELYETSGHWDKFKNELFRTVTREKHEFAVKPMNCPHHTQIYARRQHSYRELPQRYANTTMCYRDEQTGELQGLSRVRGFTQDDAHVFCRWSQAKEEALKIWDIISIFYGAVGFDLAIRLSLREPKTPEKYLGTPDMWEKSEKVLREIIKSKKVDFTEARGEAAFYGPKIDFLGRDSLGREWQVATIQLDSNMPERFDLVCMNEKSEKERIVMIHAAIMGSIERFLSIIIEHFAGAFPLWLSPIQVGILPVSQNFTEFSRKVSLEFQNIGIRAEVDDANETVGYKIRKAEKMKIPYMIVIGEKEANGKTLAVRKRGEKAVQEMSRDGFMKKLVTEIKEKII